MVQCPSRGFDLLYYQVFKFPKLCRFPLMFELIRSMEVNGTLTLKNLKLSLSISGISSEALNFGSHYFGHWTLSVEIARVPSIVSSVLFKLDSRSSILHTV